MSHPTDEIPSRKLELGPFLPADLPVFEGHVRQLFVGVD